MGRSGQGRLRPSRRAYLRVTEEFKAKQGEMVNTDLPVAYTATISNLGFIHYRGSFIKQGTGRVFMRDRRESWRLGLTKSRVGDSEYLNSRTVVRE